MSLSREEIIRMALQCFTDGFFTHEVEEFAERIAAAEREQCAVVCDAIAEKSARSATEDEYEVLYPRMCAAAIRARGDK